MPAVQCCSAALPTPWTLAETLAEAKQAACSQGRPQSMDNENQ